MAKVDDDRRANWGDPGWLQTQIKHPDLIVTPISSEIMDQMPDLKRIDKDRRVLQRRNQAILGTIGLVVGPLLITSLIAIGENPKNSFATEAVGWLISVADIGLLAIAHKVGWIDKIDEWIKAA